MQVVRAPDPGFCPRVGTNQGPAAGGGFWVAITSWWSQHAGCCMTGPSLHLSVGVVGAIRPLPSLCHGIRPQRMAWCQSGPSPALVPFPASTSPAGLVCLGVVTPGLVQRHTRNQRNTCNTCHAFLRTSHPNDDPQLPLWVTSLIIASSSRPVQSPVQT